MELTALITAAGIAIPALTAALALWRKLRNAKAILNDNIQAGLAVVADLEQTKEKLKKVGETYDTISEKLRDAENKGRAATKELEQIKNTTKVGVEFLAEKMNVNYGQAYRIAKKTDSPFQLEHVANVGKRWRTKTSTLSEWMRKQK